MTEGGRGAGEGDLGVGEGPGGGGGGVGGGGEVSPPWIPRPKLISLQFRSGSAMTPTPAPSILSLTLWLVV